LAIKRLIPCLRRFGNGTKPREMLKGFNTPIVGETGILITKPSKLSIYKKIPYNKRLERKAFFL